MKKRFFEANKSGQISIRQVLEHITKIGIAAFVLFLLLSYVSSIERSTEFEKLFLSRDIAMFSNSAYAIPGDLEYKYLLEKLDFPKFSFQLGQLSETDDKPVARVGTEGTPKIYPYGKNSQKRETYSVSGANYLIVSKGQGNLVIKDPQTIISAPIRGQPKAGESPGQKQDNTQTTGCSNIQGAKVLMIGDSLGQGLGPHISSKVSAQSGTFSNNAISGKRIGQWAKDESSILTNALKFNPDIVFISLGVNDETSGIRKKNEQAVAEDTRALIQKIGSRPVIYWIGPPTWPGYDTSVISGIISRNIPPSVLYYDSSQLKIEPRSKDGHPSNYKSWAESVWAWCSGK
ncbi:MAG TPA: SGNH/GDSL hydrolase family protein [Candidatus Nanoarchaeia archaeon]|nr:SGNH/GDSL hydrolase family protein [Candidatus Nanoarchaeia archaeon]